MEQLAQRVLRVLQRHGARLVHGVVAQPAQHVHLGVHRRAHQLLKARLKQKRQQVRLVRHGQTAPAPALGLEQPGHRQLQRAPGVKTGGARVAQRCRLGAARFDQQLGPVGLQEAEVGWGAVHGLPRFFGCFCWSAESNQPLIYITHPKPCSRGNRQPSRPAAGAKPLLKPKIATTFTFMSL